ncbi:PQQ-binding-like beta-propeller repeat protein [Streptomyces sp. SDr-06]|uniref:outer membrane protein assembly factor BamB family protein n=1 Tax=Streptomyces sp. SDr-06 TaxID=2267702 RepID=UPI001CB93104|nr:PQQ-binding-like beta-propeller repeat protein [Streptomyces sp. SDr-06]
MPPAPPAQPPQMPPTPPAGAPGYGYPQAPPPQPGYGYPAAPGQAPTQANPYAQTQQGGYGYPGQPQYPGAPMPPQNGGGKNPFKGRPAVIVAAAVAGLLVIGGGVYLATSGGGDDKKPVADKSHGALPSGSPSVDKGDGKGNGGSDSNDINGGIKPGEARVWLHENETPLTQNGAEQYGPWRLGDVVVKAMYKEIVGYAVGDGQEKWKVSLDTPICGAPHDTTADGKIVFGVQENNTKDAKCNQLQQVDLAGGKAGWKTAVPSEGLFDIMTGFDMAITGNTVTLARMGGASGFSVTDGKKLFGTPKTGNCSADAFAGGPKLISVSTCNDPNDTSMDAPRSELLQELDPATGKSKWNFQYDKGWSIRRVYSMDPLVVYAANKDKKSWNISTFTPDGKVRSQVDSKSQLTAKCSGFGIIARQLQDCSGTAPDANTLYISTEGKDSGELGVGRSNDVVAIDLGTGKEKWHAAAPKGRMMEPLAVEGGKVVVYIEPGIDDEGAAVATLAPTGGSPTITLQSPGAAAGTEQSFYSPRVAWAGGRFFLLNGRVSTPKADKKDNAILSFGK